MALTMFVVMIILLELNGIHIEATDEDIIALGLGTADGSMKQDDVLTWINKHKTQGGQHG